MSFTGGQQLENVVRTGQLGHRRRLWREGHLRDLGYPTGISPLMVGDKTHSHIAVRSHGEDIAVQTEDRDLAVTIVLIGMIFIAGEHADKVVVGDVAVVEIQVIVVDEQRVELDFHAVVRIFGDEDEGVVFVMDIPPIISLAVCKGEVIVHYNGSVLHVNRSV